jgi:hypothetical protein
MPKPIDVVCPRCHAAAGAQCTTFTFRGMTFTDTFHEERVYKAAAANTPKATAESKPENQ